MERKEKIPIPDELVKELLPSGDIHIQEERRLFYVAMTRAKQGLYFTWAKDYGGVRLKKPSKFLQELNLIKLEDDLKTEKKVFTKDDLEVSDIKIKSTITKADLKKLIPRQYSFTQIRAYQSCPRQYYYSHILKIPLQGKAVFSYGKTMHLTMQKFFQLIMNRAQQKQADLFDSSIAAKPAKGKLSVSLDELLKIYEESWINDWFDDAESKKKYNNLGRRSLREFYKKAEKKLPEVKFLEKGFNLKVGDYSFKGEIDRVDDLDGGVQIVDYKTGNSKEKLSIDDKQQLLIYQIAYEAVFKEKVKNLKFYYLNDNTEVDFLGKPKDLEKVTDKLIDTIKKINSCDFTAKPSDFTCKYCDFKEICPFRF
jgi:DNA helicase-2/ATP-dependent DNA helicase PcrA